ncbi:MAG: hypothetical protein NDI94_00705 [Candidatus Woesearchaeota archaeon]|nr:hypothetical protein [Candidatus Woesearchaeota archaeon]
MIFPGLSIGDASSNEIHTALNSKYAQRLIMENSHLIQPWFSLLLPKDGSIERFSELTDDQIDYYGLDSIYHNNDHIMDITSLAEAVCNNGLPLVYKPNFSANAFGNFFLIDLGDSVKIIARKYHGGLFVGGPGIYRYIAESGISECDEENINIYSAILPKEVSILEGLFEYAMVNFTRHSRENRSFSGSFDQGIVEGYIDAWKYNGRSYETRHTVRGTLFPFKIENISNESARLGSSSWFSNRFGNFSATKITSPDDLFYPIFEEFRHIEKKEFREYVRANLEAAFSQYAQRLGEQGLLIYQAEATIQIDLMWCDQNKLFPVPAMTECGLTYNALRFKKD